MSEHRAVWEVERDRFGVTFSGPLGVGECIRVVAVDDPASVLAALLAESPEATVAAIEALLTNGESVKAVARALSAKLHWLNDDDRAHELAVAAVTAHGVAVRSLLSKAPKENGDA